MVSFPERLRLFKEDQDVSVMLEGSHLSLEKTDDAPYDIGVFNSIEKIHLE